MSSQHTDRRNQQFENVGLAQAPHCTGEKTEAQRGAWTYPKSHSECGTRTRIRILAPVQLSPWAPGKRQGANGGSGAGQPRGGSWVGPGGRTAEGGWASTPPAVPGRSPAAVMAAPGCPAPGLTLAQRLALKLSVSQMWPVLVAYVFPVEVHFHSFWLSPSLGDLRTKADVPRWADTPTPPVGLAAAGGRGRFAANPFPHQP